MVPGIRPQPPAVRPRKGEDESPTASRVRSSSPRVRAQAASTSQSTKPTSSALSDAVIPPSPTGSNHAKESEGFPRGRSSERRSSPSGSRSRGEGSKSYVKLKASFDMLAQRFDEMFQANAKLESKVQALESKQSEQESKTAEIVSTQIKVLLKRIKSLEDCVQEINGKELILSDNHNHYAMTDERTPKGNKPRLSSGKSKGGDVMLSDNHNHYAMTDERTPKGNKPILSSGESTGDDVMLSDNHNHYAMTDERTPKGNKPKLSSGKAKKGVLSRLSVMGSRTSSDKEGNVSPATEEGHTPKDVVLLTKPKSVIQLRAEKYELLKKKLSDAVKDDREEWEKRIDGDADAIQAHTKLQEESDLPLTIREKIALRRGSTRDVVAVKQLNQTGRLSALGIGSVPEEVGSELPGSPPAIASSEEPVVVALTLELPEEEKAMNGAPEGKLFVVEVLPRDQLPPFDSEENAMETLSTRVLPLLDNTSDQEWNEEFDALTFLRRALIHHPQCVDESLMEKLARGIDNASRNTRSVLAKVLKI